MVFAFYEKSLEGNAGTLYKCLSLTNCSSLVVHFFAKRANLSAFGTASFTCLHCGGGGGWGWGVGLLGQSIRVLLVIIT